MEASASTHEHAPAGVPTTAETAEQRNDGQLFPMVFLGSVLALYLVIGYAIYALITAVA